MVWCLELAETVNELRKLGLTNYEARSYVWLVRLGASEPRKVAAAARIPYPNTYEALRRLASMGWVELVRHRPAVYRAREPKVILRDVESRLHATFKALEDIYRRTPAEEAELVYTLRGKDRVASKIIELLDGARSDVFVAAPSISLGEEPVRDSITRAVERGVDIRVVSDERGFRLLPSGVRFRRRDVLNAIDLLVDGNKALIGLPDYTACGWIDSPQVAAHFQQFLELLWDSSAPLD
jgi:sugar-specific transcriptional regulator TrmB